MPYDGAGNYSLPGSYLAVTDTTIEVSQHNPPFEDIAAALSSVILRSGVAPMTGALKLFDGTEGLPGLSFNGDANTGLRRVSADTIALVTNGTDRLTINGTGVISGLVSVSVDNTIPRFDGTAGALQTSLVSINDVGALTAVGLTSTGAVALSPDNLNVVLSPTGTGLVTINPATAGSINRMNIGATTPGTGAFTTLSSSGLATLASARITDGVFQGGTGTIVVLGALASGAGLRLRPVNTGSAAGQMSMDTSGNAVFAGDVTANSDERLKTDWEVLPSSFLAGLAGLKAGTYSRKDTGARQVGIGAQSLQALLPEAVRADEEGILAVAYGQAALVACVALARKVLQLEARAAG